MKLSQEKLEEAALVLQRVANGSMLQMLEDLAAKAKKLGDPNSSLIAQFLRNSGKLESSLNDVTVQTTQQVLKELSARYDLVEFLEKNADIGVVADIDTNAGINETDFSGVMSL